MVLSRNALALYTVILLTIVSAQAEDAKLFFGEIPIQYVAPGEKIVLDLHRFMHPPEASVHVDGTDAESKLKNLLTDEQIGLTDGKLTIPPATALFIGQR
jgi:hypothetical protein